jgi:hypothetical protein
VKITVFWNATPCSLEDRWQCFEGTCYIRGTLWATFGEVGYLKEVEKSRDISVGIATRLRAGQPGFNSRQGQEILLISVVFRPALGPTQPPIQWVPGAVSPGVKR